MDIIGFYGVICWAISGLLGGGLLCMFGGALDPRLNTFSSWSILAAFCCTAGPFMLLGFIVTLVISPK